MNNIEKITAFFSKGETNAKKLGVELEQFVCDKEGKLAIYDEIARIIQKVCTEHSWDMYDEDGNVIGADCGEYKITLEPAGQIEISIDSFENLKEIERVYDSFCDKWESAFACEGYHLLKQGVYPLVENGEMHPDELPLIPKKRYAYMDAYFAPGGRYMMRATASTQVSIDYSSMEDCVRKIRILEKAAPFLALLMENHSGLGTDSSWRPHLLRSQIWDKMDAVRCGYIPGSMEGEFSYETYAQYIYHKPLVVLAREGEILNAGSTSAAEYLGEKELDFVEHLLSMFFFHIRLKNYIEIRVADSVSKERMLGYTALIKALMYNEEGLQKLESLFAGLHTIPDIQKAEKEIEKYGYDATVCGKKAVQILCEMYESAERLLGPDEKEYLKGVATLPMLEYLYCKDIDADKEEHAESAKVGKDYILNSTAKYHNRVVKSMYIPKMFTTREETYFHGIIKELYGIFDKVIKEYTENPEYRRLFGFDEKLERLILSEKRYKTNIPMARIDLFFDEQTKNYKFCEFNTDGASGMNEDRELNTALTLTKAYQEFADRFEVKTAELFDSWVDELLAIYEEYAAKKGGSGLPNVAIVDYLEHATTNEFVIFRDRMLARGISCEICDVRHLKWDGETCVTPGGMRVDLIYRRAVTSDVMHYYEESTDFIEAYLHNAFCLVGEFKTQIVHNKILYKILHMPQTQQILSEQENRFVKAHIPYTASLESAFFADKEALLKRVMEEKDSWIIKPEDSYGSKGVHAGNECTLEEWQGFVRECMDQNYVLQEFYTPYPLANIDFAETKRVGWQTTSNLTGLFVYNGKMQGIYSRISYDKIISTQYNEMTLPTIVVNVG